MSATEIPVSPALSAVGVAYIVRVDSPLWRENYTLANVAHWISTGDYSLEVRGDIDIARIEKFAIKLISDPYNECWNGQLDDDGDDRRCIQIFEPRFDEGVEAAIDAAIDRLLAHTEDGARS